MSSRNDTNIDNPTPNDILCGRGGGTNAHSGNIKFRKLVAAHKLRYLAASKSDKPNVARDVVREWRGMDPPGRFLTKADTKDMPKGDDGEAPVFWKDVGDKKAREKASQCLRERNGAANEAVAALVKTVTASGEACPEDYATLMNKAAIVRAQNDVTIQQQQQMFKMNQQQHQQQKQMGQDMKNMMGNLGNSGNSGGNSLRSNDFCQETFDAASLDNHQQNNQRYPIQEGSMNNKFQDPDAEDQLIEAEIQRLLIQREQQLMSRSHVLRNQGSGGSVSSNSQGIGGPSSVGSGGGGIMSTGGVMSNKNNYSSDTAQPYMGSDAVLREYEQLMQRQRKLNMMAEKMNMIGNSKNGMNNGNNNGTGGMMNNDRQGMFVNNNMNNNMPQSITGNNNAMNNNGGVGMNNHVGNQMTNQMGMQSNHNPYAAKDYMNRLRMLRQSRGGGGNNASNTRDQVMSSAAAGGYSNDNRYSGNGRNNNMGNSSAGGNNMMNNMGNNSMQMHGNMGQGAAEEFTIEEYQASLQQFLSHDGGGFGGSSKKTGRKKDNAASLDDEGGFGGSSRKTGRKKGNAASLDGSMSRRVPPNSDEYNISSMQVPTNLKDGAGGNKRNRRSSVQSVDDIDIGRNTFKSIDSIDRPSFQSMDDEDIRGTFKSVDTMDLMSIGNSINEIVDEDVKSHPEMRVKYGRRLSVASRYSRPGNKHGSTSLKDFAPMPGETVEVRTMDHGQGTGPENAGSGPKRIKKGIDPRLMAQAKSRLSVHTKDCDGPSRLSVHTKDCDGPSSRAAAGGGRGSQLSIKDLNLDGVDDDASRMSFGNISVMSELSDFHGQGTW